MMKCISDMVLLKNEYGKAYAKYILDPVIMMDEAKYPPFYLVTGEQDLIQKDTLKFAEALKKHEIEVVFYTGSYYESDLYASMVDRLYDLQDKWGIGIIDLYTDEEFNNIDADKYSFYMYDEIHPTKAGYAEWWMPEMEKQLEQILR